MNCSGPDLLSPRHRLEDRIGNPCTYFLKGTFIRMVFILTFHTEAVHHFLLHAGYQSLVQGAGRERSWFRTSFTCELMSSS